VTAGAVRCSAWLAVISWCLAFFLFDGVEHAADVEDDQYSTYEDRRYAHALGFECLAEEVEFSVTRAAR
jgi:hypothetical protein